MPVRIDPWGTERYTEYEKIMKQFGIAKFVFQLPKAHKLMRRRIVFGHRNFENVYNVLLKKKKFAIITGLVPSGPMHLGHKMVIDEVIYYQQLGADIFLTIADLEGLAVRGIGLHHAEKLAREDYVTNYIALGLKPERCQIYYQSKREEISDLAFKFANKVNFSEAKAIYGFKDSTSMAQGYVPLIQAADILHVQLDKYGGPRPTLVPVGIDQDPHIRFTRDLAFRYRTFNVKNTEKGVGIFVKANKNVNKLLDAAETLARDLGFINLDKIIRYKALYVLDAKPKDIPKLDTALLSIEKEHGGYGWYLPSSTVHRLMCGLTGGKMASSVPESAIFLTDEIEVARKKIMRCKTGGAVSLKEQRKAGGNPKECAVYELLVYHLIEDDRRLKEIYAACVNGERACGRCKRETSALMERFLRDLQGRRDAVKEMQNKYVIPC